jgi:ABC-2 type transport system permease protein
LRSPDFLRSPEVAASKAVPILPLIKKELWEVLGGRALWTMLLLMCPLVGYSYFQALSLYADASIAGQQSAVLATSLSPLDGILVPTFGAFYVAVTLLFPFVCIRVLGREKESGALLLLVQLPYRPLTLAMAKMMAIIVAWWAASIPVLCALVMWMLSGGHLAPAETSNLVLGHFTYGLLIGAIALFAASISESSATAAIVALAFTIGSWVLDFTLAGQPGLLEWASRLSLTQVLRPFEQGLVSAGLLIGVYTVIFLFVLLTGIWLVPGTTIRSKLGSTVLWFTAAVAVMAMASQLAISADVTEDRRNSFPLADERALASLREPLKVTVHLAPEDPRYVDVRRNVLAKLQRAMPDVSIRLAGAAHQLYGSVPTDEEYGLLRFVYGSRSDTTRSTSPREILPLIFALAGRDPPQPIAGTDYPGYPLAVNGQPALVWYFGGLPLLILIAWWWSRRPPRLSRIPALKEVKS